MKNEMNIQFTALSQNESFARVTVAAFIAQLDPTMDELTEIKTVVSEAVTNAIIHGYEKLRAGKRIYFRHSRGPYCLFNDPRRRSRHP